MFYSSGTYGQRAIGECELGTSADNLALTVLIRTVGTVIPLLSRRAMGRISKQGVRVIRRLP